MTMKDIKSIIVNHETATLFDNSSTLQKIFDHWENRLAERFLNKRDFLDIVQTVYDYTYFTPCHFVIQPTRGAVVVPYDDYGIYIEGNAKEFLYYLKLLTID